jgi:hypothetical protein
VIRSATSCREPLDIQPPGERYSSLSVAPIDDIRSKVERAGEHVADLKSEIGRFFATEPYARAIKDDPQTGERVCYLSVCKDVPLRVSIIAGDAIHNIRSALDYLAYQLVRVGSGSPGPFASVYFPISESALELEDAIQRKLKGARPEAKDAIRAVKPYKGGNWPLWHLHRLNIIDKHRLLVAAGNTGFRNMGPQDLEMMRKIWTGSHGSEPFPLTGGEWMALKGFPLKAGDELVRGRTDTEINYQYRIHFQVAFNEPGVIQRQPVLETIEGMAKVVDNIISDFASML